ncbi:MAG TPA: SAM-dependent methyltransferase [Bryobacteraceae bacterium]
MIRPSLAICLAMALVMVLPLAPLRALNSGDASGDAPGDPSRIAIEAAAARAVGAHDPDPFTRNPDWLATPFLSPSELALIFSHPINRAVDQDPRISMLDPDVVPLVKLNDVRTRFIDDRLRNAIEAGASQVVILDAGLDSRPYRFRALLEKAKVWELDNSATQEMKQRRVHDIFGAPPPNVRYVPIDLDREKLTEALRGAGFRSSERTFFIWESGCMYHPTSAVMEILREIAQSPASSLVMDFGYQDDVARARKNPNSGVERFDAAWGQPWLFGVPKDTDAFFIGLGFEPVELMPADGPVAIRRYLTHRDLSVVGQGQPSADLPVTLAELAVRR